MARNKLSDLNDHLFAQLERLNDETIEESQIVTEIEKAKAMESIAKQIIDIEKVSIDKKRVDNDEQRLNVSKFQLIMKAVKDGNILSPTPDKMGNLLGLDSISPSVEFRE